MRVLNIKVRLSDDIPTEAELIKILLPIRNRSGQFKAAACHYFDVLGRLANNHKVKGIGENGNGNESKTADLDGGNGAIDLSESISEL